MDASKNKCKLIFSGCCNLSDDELAELYNLDLLTDEELASVDLERKSLIDDYRHLHELSLLREREQERKRERERERQREEAKLERQCQMYEATKRLMTILPKSENGADNNKNKKLPDGRKYSFQLLNQLIKKEFELDQFSLYMEQHFNSYTEYHSDPSMPLLPAPEREKRRFWAHCDYLENLYYNGGSTRALNIVVIALIRFNKAPTPSPPKVLAGKTRSRIPRPTNHHQQLRFR